MIDLKEELLIKSKELIEDKLECVEQFYEFSKKQLELLKNESEDFEEDINFLLDEKSNIIFKINKIDDEFVDTFEKLKSILPGNDLEEVADIESFKLLQQKIAQVFDIFRYIKDIEASNQEYMQKRYLYIKDQIRKVNDANSTSKYFNTQISDLDKGFFVDKKK